MASVEAQFFGYLRGAAVSLPRFDGRRTAFQESEPARGLARGSLTLRYWNGDTDFHTVVQVALSLALARARTARLAFFYQRRGDSRIQRELRRIGPDVPLICIRKLSKLGAGGAEEITRAIREHHASVTVVDNLGRLLPRIHWKCPVSRIDDAEREVLRGLRRLISDFDRPIEIVLFHLKTEAKAREFLEEGLVDEVEEVRS